MSIVRRILGGFMRCIDPWVYGTCNGRAARRHRATGTVQFVLWKAGERGHTEDYWHRFDASHWPNFKPATSEAAGSGEGEK